ncbi:MAG: hypothetical protein ACE5HW_06935 [Candidatus Methanofastidiosia archaeon]
MKKSTIPEMEFQLRKLFTMYSDLFAYHQWPLEHLRWIELIFALVSRITDRPESEVRGIIEYLDELGLMDIDDLSEISEIEDDVDLDFVELAEEMDDEEMLKIAIQEITAFDSQHIRRIAEFLFEAGFTVDETRDSILVMYEAAKSLKKYHDGKIQKYLRKYGQLMIKELSQNFSFSKMDKSDVKYAFTYWLQNVLNMPISLEDEGIEEFCRKLGRKPKELVDSVDKLDINLAIVDDIIQSYLIDQMPAKEQQEETGVRE